MKYCKLVESPDPVFVMNAKWSRSSHLNSLLMCKRPADGAMHSVTHTGTMYSPADQRERLQCFDQRERERERELCCVQPTSTRFTCFVVLRSTGNTVLYCTALYCTVLYCAVLYCTVLYCAVLYCTVLYCTALHCTVLYCTVLYCTVLYCTELQSACDNERACWQSNYNGKTLGVRQPRRVSWQVSCCSEAVCTCQE